MWFSFIFLHFLGCQTEGSGFTRVVYDLGMLLLEVLNCRVSSEIFIRLMVFAILECLIV